MSIRHPFQLLIPISLLTLAAVFSCCSNSSAAVVTLKSGQIIEGEIIERDEDSIKIETGIGFPVTYFFEEIEQINELELAEPEARTPAKQTSVTPPPVEPVEIFDEPARAPELNEAKAPPEPLKETDAHTHNTNALAISSEDISISEEKKTKPPEEPAKESMQDVIKNTVSRLSIPKMPQPEMTEGIRKAPEATEEIKNFPPEDDIVQLPNITGKDIRVEKEAEPITDIENVEISSQRKEHPSPFGPTIKPRGNGTEPAAPRVTYQQESPPLRQIANQNPKAKNLNAPNGWTLSGIKEGLYQVPVEKRQSALKIVLFVLGIIYVLVCYPLMKIAQNLGKAHSWLIWIPVVQIVYYIQMAGKPWRWIVFMFIPFVNVLLLIVLFVNILQLLKKPSWLIVLILLPGINIFVLWYLSRVEIPLDVKPLSPHEAKFYL